MDNLFLKRENGFVSVRPYRQPPTVNMDILLPSDIWRAKVLPYLDKLSRVDLNRLLEPETRVAEKMATDNIAYNMAIRGTMRILDNIGESTTVLQKVKRTTRLLTFAQTPIGRAMLKTEKTAAVFLRKLDDFESEYPPVWWKRSPYRKTLKTEMERLRAIILA